MNKNIFFIFKTQDIFYFTVKSILTVCALEASDFHKLNTGP